MYCPEQANKGMGLVLVRCVSLRSPTLRRAQSLHHPIQHLCSRLLLQCYGMVSVGITAAVVSADIANLSAMEILALTTDLRGVCYRNADIYYGSPVSSEILVELRRF